MHRPFIIIKEKLHICYTYFYCLGPLPEIIIEQTDLPPITTFIVQPNISSLTSQFTQPQQPSNIQSRQNQIPVQSPQHPVPSPQPPSPWQPAAAGSSSTSVMMPTSQFSQFNIHSPQPITQPNFLQSSENQILIQSPQHPVLSSQPSAWPLAAAASTSTRVTMPRTASSPNQMSSSVEAVDTTHSFEIQDCYF